MMHLKTSTTEKQSAQKALRIVNPLFVVLYFVKKFTVQVLLYTVNYSTIYV